MHRAGLGGGALIIQCRPIRRRPGEIESEKGDPAVEATRPAYDL